jgi:serine/threonine protein kinase/Tol biopolymer transport system component
MSPARIPGEKARFDGFELIVSTAELRSNDGSRTHLSEQTFRILLALLEKPGELVQREELRKRLWPNDTVVEFEHGISAAMNRLRQALGDSAERPRFIETLARRGYRWKTAVEWVNPAPEVPPEQAPRGWSHESLSGRKVSHYRVLEIVGGGGMGVVYKAEDVKLGRPVALKFLPDEFVDDPVAMRRFEREARAASSLNHPNICTIHAIDEYEGKHFIVMELLEGKTLREWIAENHTVATERRPPFAECVRLAIQIANGLSAAHEKGLIHRDIKPANIIFTRDNCVKILDFGLAKRQDIEYVDESLRERTIESGDPNLTLTRMGLALGTAGYMSPEQIRGERLDARTDIFSFGLVLYEMTTGRRAFTGETAPQLHAAILENTTRPVHELNPEVSPALARIIDRALEKDRDLRYQTVSEMRAALETLSRRSSRRWFQARVAIPIAVVVVVAAIALAWYWNQAGKAHPRREFRQRQLTASSSDDPVTGGAISPDGKYLVYTDLEGIHLKLVESGETQSVPAPAMLQTQTPTWQIGAWLPDSTHFFAIADLPDQPNSLWNIPVAGGNERKIADDANPWGVSSDGFFLAFTRRGDHEIWLTDPNGEHARKLWDSGDASTFRAVQWSPDGKRLAYIRSKSANDRSEAQIEIRELNSGSPVVLVSGAAARELTGLEYSFRDMDWLPDGRLVFLGGEPDIRGTSCNLWEAHVDPRTGRFTSDPQRITNWAGFCISTFSHTADSSKFVFARSSDLWVVYAAPLDRAKFRLGDLRKLAYTEDLSSPAGWSRDGSAVYIRSNREGSWGIYKQPLNGGPAEPIISRLDNVSWSTPESPDGKWLIYTIRDFSDTAAPVRILRIPVGGGPAHEIARGRYDKVLCPELGRAQCVVAQMAPNHTALVFLDFDPAAGKGRELARFDDEHADQFAWDLSPDGTKLVLHRDFASSFQVLPLGSGADSKPVLVPVENGTHLRELFWDVDGKGLFASAPSEHGAELVYVDLKGKMRSLWEVRGSNVFLAGRPSPDGRYLAIQGSAGSSNMWMLEDF